MVKIFLAGEREAQFEAMIDTGFTGFVALPWPTARWLRIEAHATTDVSLADGVTRPRHLGMVNVRLPAEQSRTEGICILEPASRTVLLGMGFLGTLKLSLIVHDKYVALVDSDAMWASIGTAASSGSSA